jgi:hypothetical protein
MLKAQTLSRNLPTSHSLLWEVRQHVVENTRKAQPPNLPPSPREISRWEVDHHGGRPLADSRKRKADSPPASID